jgi:hypothetical protein
MDKEFERKKQSNYGIAFITTDSETAANTMIRKLGHIKKDLRKSDPAMYKSFKVRVSFSISINSYFL